MAGPVLHHDEELGGAGVDAMLPPVEWTTVENGVVRIGVLRIRRQDPISHLLHRIQPVGGQTIAAEPARAMSLNP
jgi:hypothetical protein